MITGLFLRTHNPLNILYNMTCNRTKRPRTANQTLARALAATLAITFTLACMAPTQAQAQTQAQTQTETKAQTKAQVPTRATERATAGATERASLSVPRAEGAMTPVMVYLAQNPTASPAPILILSHGFGGSELGLAALARDAANASFDTYVIGHRETGRSALHDVMAASDVIGELTKAVSATQGNALRQMDLDALIAHLGADFSAAPLRVMGGHSMGAQLTMIEAGAKTRINVAGKDRFDAYIALSFQGPGHVFPADAWGMITKPTLLITGTEDRALTGDYTTRLPAFDGLPDGQATLAIIDGAKHRDLSGKGQYTAAAQTRQLTVEFLTEIAAARGRTGPPRITDRAGVTLRHK